VNECESYFDQLVFERVDKLPQFIWITVFLMLLDILVMHYITDLAKMLLMLVLLYIACVRVVLVIAVS